MLSGHRGRRRGVAVLAALVAAATVSVPVLAGAATYQPGKVVATSVRQEAWLAQFIDWAVDDAIDDAQAEGLLGPRASLAEVLDDRTRVRNATQPWFTGGVLKWKTTCGTRDNDLKALDKKKTLAGWCWPKTEQEAGRSLSRSDWIPQGIASTAESSATGTFEGRRATAVSWYAGARGAAAEAGSRVTFFTTPTTGRTMPFTHVTLARAYSNGDNDLDLRPVFAHAGGIAWSGPYLFVPQTDVGVRVFDVRRIYRVENGPDLGRDPVDGTIQGAGARYVMLEVAQLGQRGGGQGCRRATLLPLCFSTVSIDRSVAPPRLVVGEYVSLTDMKRLRRGAAVVRWVLGPDGLPVVDSIQRAVSEPVRVTQTYATQGLVVLGSSNQYFFSAGDIGKGWFVWERTGDGRKPLVTQGWPRGPQSLTRDPVKRRLWSVTEIPGRRTVFWVPECEMRRVKGRCT